MRVLVVQRTVPVPLSAGPALRGRDSCVTGGVTLRTPGGLCDVLFPAEQPSPDQLRPLSCPSSCHLSTSLPTGLPRPAAAQPAMLQRVPSRAITYKLPPTRERGGTFGFTLMKLRKELATRS